MSDCQKEDLEVAQGFWRTPPSDPPPRLLWALNSVSRDSPSRVDFGFGYGLGYGRGFGYGLGGLGCYGRRGGYNC
ncbi:hypothetical protein DUI87_06808 [Hirundo rustica rustica]|uniref:Keratin n=1 Tax=Hirundo rustica rustica TaxID=333673 RepID=A0A3M0KNF4_HIRRU|nr:hypothetical protein DUI87_06808 [Hirundo rustica rustica]